MRVPWLVTFRRSDSQHTGIPGTYLQTADIAGGHRPGFAKHGDRAPVCPAKPSPGGHIGAAQPPERPERASATIPRALQAPTASPQRKAAAAHRYVRQLPTAGHSRALWHPRRASPAIPRHLGPATGHFPALWHAHPASPGVAKTPPHLMAGIARWRSAKTTLPHHPIPAKSFGPAARHPQPATRRLPPAARYAPLPAGATSSTARVNSVRFPHRRLGMKLRRRSGL